MMADHLCPVHEYCGGCIYQGVPYHKQLQLKQKRVEKLLGSFHDVLPIIGMDDPYHYRNKVQISFGYDDEGRIISGFYVPASHVIVPVDDCRLCDERLNDLISGLSKLVARLHIPVYDERSGRGCLRHILLRSSDKDGCMAVLVTGSIQVPGRLIERIRKEFPQITTLVQNINRFKTSRVLGPQNKVLYGKGYIVDGSLGLDFRISPSSFYQVNRFQTTILYKKALEAAGIDKDKTVLDAYCGIGTIGLCAAEKARKVVGVEVNRDAIRDAVTNMKTNGIENAVFICDDAGRYMSRLDKKEYPDVLIMDPPRSGSDEKFLKSLIKAHPERVIYISCNPETLRRDLSFLTRYYDIGMIQPVDMFPFTGSIETIAALKIKDHGGR